MRIIPIDMSSDRPTYPPIFGGYEGEHNETRLVVTLPERMLNENITKYRFVFETSYGEVIYSTYCLPSSNQVSIDLWQQVMVAKELKFCIDGYDNEEDCNLISKTGSAILLIRNDVSGIETPRSAEGAISRDDLDELLAQAESTLRAADAAATASNEAAQEAKEAAKDAKSVKDEFETKLPIKTTDLADNAVTPEKTDFTVSYPGASFNQDIVPSSTVNDMIVRTLYPKQKKNYYISKVTGMVTQGADINDNNYRTTDDFKTVYLLENLASAVTFTYSPECDWEFALYVESDVLNIPDLVIETDNIKGGAVGMDKLSDDVKNAINSGSGGGSEDIDLSDYYTIPETDAAIIDAMYDIVDVSITDYEHADCFVNGIALSREAEGELRVGHSGGGSASAGWSSDTLIIPAYVRDQYGKIHKVTAIDDGALQSNRSGGFIELNIYVPDTVTKFGNNCFIQTYGDQGGHLNIFYNGTTPTGYDMSTTTLYDLNNPFWLGKFYTKNDINNMISGQIRREIVDSLPPDGIDGTIYMLNVGRLEELGTEVFSASWDGYTYVTNWKYAPGNYYTDIMQLSGYSLNDSSGNYYSLGLDFNSPTKEGKYLITFTPELNKSTVLSGYLSLEEGIDIKIYTETPQGNIYEEYMWINNSWELIGSTEVDMTNYYTRDEIDSSLGNIESALDSIITIQNELLGGGTV